MYGVLSASLRWKTAFKLSDLPRVTLTMMDDLTKLKIHTLINRLKKVENEARNIRQELHALAQGNNGGKRKRLAPNKNCSSSISSNGFDETDVNFCPEENFASKIPRAITSNSPFQFEDDYVVVYTDGACENNGKWNAKAGIGVWFGDNNPMNISKPLIGKATNNRAEIYACIEALILLKNQGITKVKMHTDSQFTINCITQWINNWKRNNWKTAGGDPVKNKEELVVLDEVMTGFADIKWVHVRGHAGIRGNEGADQLARNGSLQYVCSN